MRPSNTLPMITYSQLIDAILAHSALRGDITGRGLLIVDNDCPAIREILATLLPAVLSDLGADYTMTDDGATLNASAYTEPQLVRHIVNVVLAQLGGKTQPIALSPPGLSTAVTELPSLSPYGP